MTLFCVECDRNSADENDDGYCEVCGEKLITEDQLEDLNSAQTALETRADYKYDQWKHG